jgi:hypothetical protein
LQPCISYHGAVRIHKIGITRDCELAAVFK